MPFERGRAGLILAGLLAFTAGFAVAAVLVVADLGGSVPYLIAISVGLAGIGVIGFGMSRGTVPMPDTAIWSPATLRLFSAARDLPAVPVISVLYVLAGIGIAGNIAYPLLTR